MQIAGKNIRWSQMISIIINLFLITEVVLLIMQNRDLKAQIDKISMPPEPLKSGEVVSAFEGLSLDGSHISISYEDVNKKYLLFLLSTTCHICERNLTNWNTIVANQNDPNTIVYGIAVEDQNKVEAYVTKQEPKFKIAMVQDTSFVRKYKVFGYPQTLLINGQGKVIQSWVGMLTEEKITELKNLIKTPQG